MKKKRRRHEEPDNADRWVVSYADFITLLFAFFTTMYAISHVDLGKLRQFTGSMKVAFKAPGHSPTDPLVLDGIKPVSYADIGLEQDVRSELKKFDVIEGVVVSRDARGVIISVGDSLLFDVGSADLKQAARPLLATVSALIRKTRRQIIIEGHTDNLPPGRSRYQSNLELSTSRAASVFSALREENSDLVDRFAAAGYGEYRPVTSNSSPEGRMRNRRVDIIFVTEKTGA